MEINELIKRSRKLIKQLEISLRNSITDYFVSSFKINNGFISNIDYNYKLISNLEKKVVADTLGIKQHVLEGVAQVVGKSLANNQEIINKDITDAVIKHASRNIDRVTNLSPIFEKVKGQSISLLAKFGGTSLTDLRQQINLTLVEKSLITKEWTRWTSDIYSQYERIATNEQRKYMKLEFAMYEGGEIESTREFCSERNGNVYHESEIADWANEDWVGKNESGYDPFIDCGGYNCRHRLRWISTELALQLRPDAIKFINQAA